MFNYKNRMPSQCSEEKAKNIAHKFYNFNQHNRNHKNENAHKSWIVETKNVIELHSIAGPFYDDPNEYELIQEYNSYKELLSDNIYKDLVRSLKGETVYTYFSIPHKFYITQSRDFNITIYKQSCLLLNGTDMNILGVYDWLIDYYKNKSNIEFLNDKNKTYSYYDICNQDEFEKELNNYFDEYINKHNIVLLKKEEQINLDSLSVDTVDEKLLDDFEL